MRNLWFILLLLSTTEAMAGLFSNDDFRIGPLSFAVTIPDSATFVAARSMQTVRYAHSSFTWDIIPQASVKFTETKTVEHLAKTTIHGNTVSLSFGAGRLTLAEENPDTAKGGTLRDVAHLVEMTVLRADGKYVTVALDFFRYLPRKTAIERAHGKRLEEKIRKRYDGLHLQFSGYVEEQATNPKTGEVVMVDIRQHDVFLPDATPRADERLETFQLLHGN